MTENEEEKEPFLCPFCGAPQRTIVPSGTVQVKCQYCGGVILVPPWLSGKTLRCGNHPERLSVGICNDCGRNFCGECLHIYHLKTRDTKATLYLDRSCLRKRYADKASKIVWSGILLLGYGIFSAIVSLMIGIFFILFGVGVITYGIFKKRETPMEITVDKALVKRKQMEAEPELMDLADAERLYSELLSQYVHKWGAVSGIDLLRSEIRAYIRQGFSFPEAVKKIHARTRGLS